MKMNPPFVVWIMEYSFKHIQKALHNPSSKITVYITIPVWDIFDREKLNKFCNTNKKTDYINPELVLKNDKNLIIDRLYCQNDYGYTDYVKYKNESIITNFAQTNILVASNYLNKNNIDLSILKGKYLDNK